MADKNMEAQISVEFEEATSRQSLNSGETINTLWGKVKRWLSDLKTVAFSGSYNDLSDKPTSLPANGGNSETVNNHTVESDVPADAVFTDTVYSTGTDTTSGLTKLYTSTGDNTDGAMTQKAITEALSSGSVGNADSINGIPVDLTGIYNTQVIGYDEKNNKIIPMDKGIISRTETIIPSSSSPKPWTNTETSNSTVESSYNYPYITRSSSYPYSFSAKFVTTEPYAVSDLTKVKYTTTATSGLTVNASVEFSKTADFSEISARFSGATVTGDISELKGVYYIRIYIYGTNDSLSGTYRVGMNTLTLDMS